MVMGRPKLENARKYRHTFRLKKDEEAIFQAKLRKLKTKDKSGAIRKWVMFGAKHDC